MTDHQMEDLKDFIRITVGQSEANLGDRIDKVEKRLEDHITESKTEHIAIGETIVQTADNIVNKLKPFLKKSDQKKLFKPKPGLQAA